MKSSKKGMRKMKVRKAYKITGVSQGNVYTTECIYATSQKEAIEEFQIRFPELAVCRIKHVRKV